MNRIRAIIFFIGQASFTLAYIPVILIALPMPVKLRSRVIGGWAYLNVYWVRISAGIKHKIVGLENLPDYPCVIAANHQSMWETIAPQTFLPPHVWVLKKELFRIPVFGWGLAATKPIAIDRDDPRNAVEQVTQQGRDAIANGRFVVIYPEGTRMPLGQLGKFKTGVAKLARAANVPIVPMAHNGAKYWPKNNWTKSPGTIECRFGPPISVDDKTNGEVVEEVRNWIASNLP